jgi:hypothetical protein
MRDRLIVVGAALFVAAVALAFNVVANLISARIKPLSIRTLTVGAAVLVVLTAVGSVLTPGEEVDHPASLSPQASGPVPATTASTSVEPTASSAASSPTALASPRSSAGRARTLASMKPDPDSWDVVPLKAYGKRYSTAIAIDTADCNTLHPFIGGEMVSQAYDLGGTSRYVRFTGTAGVAGTSGSWNGSLQFRVFGDGEELARSVATKDEPATFDVDISAIRTIEIVLMKGREMGSCYDFTAAWLDASMRRLHGTAVAMIVESIAMRPVESITASRVGPRSDRSPTFFSVTTNAYPMKAVTARPGQRESARSRRRDRHRQVVVSRGLPWAEGCSSGTQPSRTGGTVNNSTAYLPSSDDSPNSTTGRLGQTRQRAVLPMCGRSLVADSSGEWGGR